MASHAGARKGHQALLPQSWGDSAVATQSLPMASQPAPEDSGDWALQQQAQILVSPYQLSGRSALFRSKYADWIGCSVLPKQPGSAVLGMSANVIYRAIECVGYKRVEEIAAEAKVAENKRKLSMLITSSGNSHPFLQGPEYLTVKPYISRMYQICNKWYLVHSLRQAEDRMRQRGQSFLTGSGGIFCHEVFTPFTINMAFAGLEDVLSAHPGTYLAKPVGGSMGERLQLVRIHGDSVQLDLLGFLKTSQFKDMQSSQVILQRYIERPLLIDKRKFDMRVYMLVINAKRGLAGDEFGSGDQPGFFVFMHPGFIRLCSTPYDPSSTDLAVHLTNQSIQAKLTTTFGQLKEVTTWYPDELNDYLNKRRRMPTKDWARDILYPKIGALLGYISAVFRYFLDDRDCPSNTFRILGVDFLVDDQLRVYLLEFNAYPAWGCQTSVLADVKPSLWREAISLSSEVVIRYRSRQPITEKELVTRQNFNIVFNSDEPDLARNTIARIFPT